MSFSQMAENNNHHKQRGFNGISGNNCYLGKNSLLKEKHHYLKKKNQQPKNSSPTDPLLRYAVKIVASLLVTCYSLKTVVQINICFFKANFVRLNIKFEGLICTR